MKLEWGEYLDVHVARVEHGEYRACLRPFIYERRPDGREWAACYTSREGDVTWLGYHSASNEAEAAAQRHEDGRRTTVTNELNRDDVVIVAGPLGSGMQSGSVPQVLRRQTPGAVETAANG